MKVVITGPTGAIGHALIEKCLSNGDEILAVCRKGSKRISSLPQNALLHVLELSLEEYETFTQSDLADLGSFDVFFHFAWNGTTGADRNNTDLQASNVRYALDAVKLASKLGCHTFIGAGSQAEYGRVEGVLTPGTPAFPENGYGIAKLCAGQLTRILCEQVGIKHIWTRILSVYGPYDGEKSMIISSLRKMLNGETVSFTKGEQEWDYLYSEDAAEAMYLLAENGVNGKVYIIGGGTARKLKEYINIMKEETGTGSDLKLGDIPYSEKQVMYLCADISELKKDVGFEPKTDFKQGIINTIMYLKNSNGV